MGFITKGGKKILIRDNKMHKGNVLIKNEKNETVGRFDITAKMNAEKIRDAKKLKFETKMDGKKVSTKEISKYG